MKIKTLKLAHFRGAVDLEISFDEKLNETSE